MFHSLSLFGVTKMYPRIYLLLTLICIAATASSFEEDYANKEFENPYDNTQAAFSLRELDGQAWQSNAGGGQFFEGNGYNVYESSPYTDQVEQPQQVEQGNVLLDVQPAQQLNIFNPRSRQAKFSFLKISPSSANSVKDDRLDNGIFLTNDKVLQIGTLPFNRYAPFSNNNSDATLNNLELCMQYDTPIQVGPDETATFRVVYGGQTLNVEPHIYPLNLVSDPQDDLRLGASGYYIFDTSDTGITFGFGLTNRGVWAYHHLSLGFKSSNKLSVRAFNVARRLADRKSPNALVDTTIEYNRQQGVVKYYVDGQLKWTVDNIGYPPNLQDSRNRLLASSPGRAKRVSPSRFTFYPVCNTRELNLADPNKAVPLYENVALLRQTGIPGYYDPRTKFWDNESLRNNTFYGQGQLTSLKQFQITKRKSNNPMGETYNW